MSDRRQVALKTIPATWSFDRADVAEGFEAHVREQLPWYELITGAVAHLARHYIPENGVVYDIGASTGNIGRALSEILKIRSARFTPIEAAPSMATQYAGPGTLVIEDAASYQYKPFDLAVCFLVLMFIPIHARRDLIERLMAECKPGGAIIVVDRIEPEGGYVDTALYRMTLAGKIAGGASAKDIVAKELSLGGVQRPLYIGELGPQFREWFRFGHFRGWVFDKR